MLIKKVPFFYDTKNGTYCYPAVLKMVLKYFYPERDYSWDDLIKLTGKKEGMWTWPQYSYITMSELGFEIRIIDAFDYDEFIENGIEYLEKEYGKDIAEEQNKHCDLKYEVENIKKLKTLIHKEKRIPEIRDIINLLSDDFLVECQVKGNHSVLIYGFDNHSLYFHDPGSLEGESCVIKYDNFEKAWAHKNNKLKGILAFKLASRNI